MAEVGTREAEVATPAVVEDIRAADNRADKAAMKKPTNLPLRTMSTF